MDPEQLVAMAELVLVESFLGTSVQCPIRFEASLLRFRSNADLGGVEKVSIGAVCDEMLEEPYKPLKPLHAGSPLPKHGSTLAMLRPFGAPVPHRLCEGMAKVPGLAYGVPRDPGAKMPRPDSKGSAGEV